MHLDVIITSSLQYSKLMARVLKSFTEMLITLFCAVFVSSICYHRKDDLVINPVYTFTTKQERGNEMSAKMHSVTQPCSAVFFVT